ncbi:MAG: ABC transporter permease [Bacteroidota bacterium]
MLKNYFKIAWRNIIKSPFYSLVNVIGLSVGIAFTLLIAAYVYGELQVNRQLKNAGNQYIVLSKWKDPNMGYPLTCIAEFPRALKQAYPHLIANYYRWDGVSSTLSKGDKHFREVIQIGDSTLLKMYGFKLLYGDKNTALNDPYSVVLTEELALKYFGKVDAIGQTINIENFKGSRHDFAVSGVLAKTPKNSVTNINDDNNTGVFMPATAAAFMGRNMDGWNNPAIAGYIELQNGVDPKSLEKPMLDLVKRNAPAAIAANLTPYIVPLKSYYLQANNNLVQRMLYTLSFVGLFILLMAIINFINMCIARSSGRMKEMGIRKVLGGMRKQLIWQFLTESTLLVMIATLVAMLLYIIARPFFSDVLGKDILGFFAFPVYFYFFPLVLAVVIGLLAGFYPALVLSSLKSVDSLKGKLGAVKESVLTRKTLVAFQFGIAIVVLISSLVIAQQINLFFSKDLGYNKDFVVYAPLPRDWSKAGVDKMETISSQLAQLPGVSHVSLSWEIPNGANAGNTAVYRPGADSSRAPVAQMMVTDNQYAATYNIPLKAGVFFTPAYTPADAGKIVINQTQAKALGWNDPAAAIGQQVRIQGSPGALTICGVTADFHFGSMQQRIPPIFFLNVNSYNIYRYFSFKLKGGNLQQSLISLQTNWDRLMPGAPFEYKFMDDALTKLYQTEIQLKKAAYMATLLATIIVLLGVLGLISLSVQKRTREIGIRKVLGSSVAGISLLFLKDFLAVVLIAGLVACPLAYLIMQHWLNDYAYKISLSISPFILAVSLLTFITALIITLQTIKAAFANPAESLRSE